MNSLQQPVDPEEPVTCEQTGIADDLKDQEPKQGSKNSVVQFVLEMLQTLVLAFVLYFAIDFVVARVQVENISMLPTLHSGEFLMVNKLAYRSGDYQRGDIIVFHSPTNPKEDYVKRIIGIPGDTIRINDGTVSINGVVQDEPYIMEPMKYSGMWEVPDGSLFVLGDNRNESYDSHAWNYLPQKKVIGKAFLIYWPPEDVRILKLSPQHH